MKYLEYYIVDVFAEKKYAGNQLAVFRNSAGVSTEDMQNIAREINFSETTFIDCDEVRNDGFDVRIFTPTAELPFAGHPTLGTTFIIKEIILQEPAKKINLNLKVGQIPVDLTYKNGALDYLWMQQINPSFSGMLSRDDVAPILNVAADDLDDNFPIQEVSTGIPFFMVPMKSLATVENIKINRAEYDVFVEKYNPHIRDKKGDKTVSSAFFVFCDETVKPENQLHARMFDPYYGVPEDPATGSANGCFLGYLLKHNYFGKQELNLRVEQGFEMGRPSLILLDGKVVGDDEISVRVGGQVQMIANGKWWI